MKKLSLAAVFAVVLTIISCNRKPELSVAQYKFNPDQLVSNSYVLLPLGAVKPSGWLKTQLEIQKNSLTGHLDEFWPDLMTSSWHGGDGEAWERGPYYLDGLIPLAFILEDSILTNKVGTWMDFILTSQQESGWFGPEKNTDRWPLAVALKGLKQYYEGSGDDRALTIIKKYFEYLNTSQPDWPDDKWRGVRAMENAVTGYWLYRQTGDDIILDAIRKIHDNCYDWTEYFNVFPWDSEALQEGSIPDVWDASGLTAHVVNVAMATKYPGIWYQQSTRKEDLLASLEGIEKLDLHHGQVGGRFSGDEHLSGKNPTQGTEMCAIVEYMFSLENLIEITGDNQLADRLELLAFNSLPGTQTADGWGHQYDQQTNQVAVSNAPRNWSSNGDESNVFGMEPNFGCCTANMHQGWPKFTQSLWMASPDGGLAAISYAPCSVEAKVGQGQTVKLVNQTDYPFDNKIRISIESEKPGSFPLYLRIPKWCKQAEIKVNEVLQNVGVSDFVKIERKWRKGDVIDIILPMEIEIEKRYKGAIAIKTGPLYFSAQILKFYGKEDLGDHSHDYPAAADWKINAGSSWNYGLLIDPNDPASSFELTRNPIGSYPFADAGDPILNEKSGKYRIYEQNPPLMLKVKAKKIPEWIMDNNSAGEIPLSPVYSKEPITTINLVPYAFARLRISEFPVIKSE